LIAAAAVFVSDTGAADAEQCGFSANVVFRESAPTDRFTIANTSSRNWQLNRLKLDMSHSLGNLIFDVTATGAGVDVFQPFVSEAGSAQLSEQPVITDGDQMIELAFSQFAPGADYRFSIDVDDQLTDSRLGQTRIDGSEIQGAVIMLTVEDDSGLTMQVSGSFDENSQIQLSTVDCQN